MLEHLATCINKFHAVCYQFTRYFKFLLSLSCIYLYIIYMENIWLYIMYMEIIHKYLVEFLTKHSTHRVSVECFVRNYVSRVQNFTPKMSRRMLTYIW